MKVFMSIILFIFPFEFNNLCEIKMSKAELLNGKITLDCDFYKHQELLSFKIKTPKKPTVVVYGDSLYDKARSYVKGLKKGDIITIFDIETKTKIHKSSTVIVTISD